MAELTHFYVEQNTVQTESSGTYTDVPGTTISGGSLTANTKYLIVARALWNSASISTKAQLRVLTPDNSTIETKSEVILEAEQSQVDEYVSYLFVHSFKTDVSPGDVRFQALSDGGGSFARVDQVSLWLFDLTAITAKNVLETAYFNASDAGPTDALGNWNNDDNAFDGILANSADSDSGAGDLTGEGTTASTSGATIGAVQARLNYLSSGTGLQWLINEDSPGGALLGNSGTLQTHTSAAWSAWVTLTPPSGGWTWQKVNDLAVTLNPAFANQEVFRAEVQVLSSLGYVEDIQAGGGGDYSKTADTTVIAQIAGIDLLDPSTLIDTYHFDASDAGPADAGASWDNDANAFDGSLTTSAAKNDTTSNVLSGDGTTAPTTGATIGLVTVKVTYDAGASPMDIEIWEDVAFGTQLLVQTLTESTKITQEFEIPAPAGGWTWQKVNDLAIGWGSDSDASGLAYNAAVLVYGADPTPEQLILGYGMAEINNTGRFFRHSLHAAYDTSTSAERAFHQAEGEDGAETRISGYAIRHKASSGAPDVTLFGQSENAGGGQNADGGGYLIALPTALFADFVDDYTAANAGSMGTEITVATTGAYTPTLNGNHLVFGGYVQTVLSQTGLFKGHIEEGTTEIRTGDSTPTHNQGWDTTKDLETVRTFQRYSITSEVTLNLQGLSANGAHRAGHRWLIVVNLNEPAAGGPALFPPFLRRPPRHVRM